MHFPDMPKVAFQRQGQFDEASWHSILISVLRGLAAIVVATAHLRAAMYPAVRDIASPPLWFQGLAFVSGFAHQAVLLFFVISGWLVGGSLLNRLSAPNAIVGYTIDRLTRLWTVLLPTFLLTLVFALGIGATTLDAIDLSPANPYSATSFSGNLFGLQRVLVPVLGGNFPLWSLANETWYYLLFPLLAVACTTQSNTARLSCAAALLVTASLLPTAITAYFLVWLLGVGFSRIRIECGSGVRWAWFLLVLAGAGYFRLTGELDEFDVTTLGQDLICSVLYLVLLSSLQFKVSAASPLARPVRNSGKFLAEFSFSLYVLHVPVIGLLQHWSASQLGLRQLSPSAPLHTALFFGMLAVLIGSAYLSYLLFESKTYRIRNGLKKRFLRSSAPRPDGKVLTIEP